MTGLSARARRRLRKESGQALVLIVLSLVSLLGMAALAVDVGYAYYVQRSLQASADAAALAGAQELPNGSTATAIARTYSASEGQKNARANVRGVTTTASAKCVSIAPCYPVNAVEVRESVSVPTRFAKVLGIDTFDVNVRSTACSPCASRPLDVMLVLDRTLSMCMDTHGNYDGACTDLANARNGLKTFLGYMDPALDRVGLAVFPPATSISNRCSTPPTPSIVSGSNPPRYTDASYTNSSYPYVVAQLETNYKANASAPLRTSSNLVSTVNCIKANGVTSYALALEKAQAELDTRGRPDVQDVIVFFSDGAANFGPTYYSSSSPYRTRPCQQGVNSAAAIKARGTLIYSIGYDVGADNDPDGAQICQSHTGHDESPYITAVSALRQIASKPEAFFNQPDPGSLNTIYTNIAADISGAKLIGNDVS
jgi:Flp pilus assembly protein TadG